MADDKKNKGVSGVSRTGKVSPADRVKDIERVQTAGAVKSVEKSGGIRGRKATRELTSKERDYLHQLVNEEAEKLFGSEVDEEQKKIIGDAVKMAIDASIIDDEEAEELQEEE